MVLANSEWIEPGLNTSLFNEIKPNKKANKSKLSPIILVLFLTWIPAFEFLFFLSIMHYSLELHPTSLCLSNHILCLGDS